MTLYATMADVHELSVRLARIEKAVSTMAWWLVAAQTGFGQQDARGIEDILCGAPDAHASAKEAESPTTVSKDVAE